MKSNYSKIIKWVLLALLILSLGVVGWACLYGFDKNNAIAVDVIFYWVYAILVVAVCSIIFVGGIIAVKNDKKFLVKALALLIGAVVLVAVVYMVSPGSPALGMLEQPDAATLKITDTLLNLTYLIAGATILSIIVGEIIVKVHNKKLAK